MSKKEEKKKVEKKLFNKFFSKYINIFCDNKKETGISVKLFTIYFLRAFALDLDEIDEGLKKTFDECGSIDDNYFYDKKNLKKLEINSNIPAIFYKYKNGGYPLSNRLISACSDKKKGTTNVTSRIKKFLKDNISTSNQMLIIDQIQKLLSELGLTDETLSKFDKLLKDGKKEEYFSDTFQEILIAESKDKIKKADPKSTELIPQPMPLSRRDENEIFRKFRQIDWEYRFKEAIVPYNEKTVAKINEFVNKIDTDIIEAFKTTDSENTKYQHIKKFSCALKDYITPMLPERSAFESYGLNSYINENNAEFKFEELKSLYSAIYANTILDTSQYAKKIESHQIEKILKIFQKNADDCQIKYFIQSEPFTEVKRLTIDPSMDELRQVIDYKEAKIDEFYSILTELKEQDLATTIAESVEPFKFESIEKAQCFIKTIYDKIIDPLKSTDEESLYQKINKFTHTLNEYIKYTWSGEICEDKIIWKLNPIKNSESFIDFFSKVVEYGQILRSLYNDICNFRYDIEEV